MYIVLMMNLRSRLVCDANARYSLVLWLSVLAIHSPAKLFVSYVCDEKGLDCSEPGSTAKSLSINPGFWRTTLDSFVIRECLNEVGGGADHDTYM